MQWADLSALIRSHNLRFPQLRLVLDGESIPEADYVRNHFGLGTKHSDFLMNRRLDEHNLVRYLRNGATLIIDSVSSVHAPLSKFLSVIECDLGINTSVNLYASWKERVGSRRIGIPTTYMSFRFMAERSGVCTVKHEPPRWRWMWKRTWVRLRPRSGREL